MPFGIVGRTGPGMRQVSVQWMNQSLRTWNSAACICVVCLWRRRRWMSRSSWLCVGHVVLLAVGRIRARSSRLWTVWFSCHWSMNLEQCHATPRSPVRRSVIFVLICFLVLVLVFQLFFSFSFVLVLQYFFVFVLVLPTTKEYQTCWRRRVDDLPKYRPPLVTDSTLYGRSTRKCHNVC